MNSILDRFMSGFLVFVMAVLVILVLVLIPVVFIRECKDSKKPTFELKKSEWVCANEIERTTTVMMMVGKVMVPTFRSHKECTQWSRSKD